MIVALQAKLAARAAGRGLWAPWLWLSSHYAGRGGRVATLAVLGALQSVIFLPTLYLVRFAFDDAVPKGHVGVLIWIGLALVVFRIAGSALALIARSMSLKVTKAAIAEMRRDLIAALYALPRDFFGRNDAARVQTRIVMETERLDNLSSLLLSAMLPAALTSACLLAALIYLNFWLVVALLALLPLMWLGTVIGGRHVKREVKGFQDDFEVFSHGVQFVLRQMDLTRVRGFEDAELANQTRTLRRLESSGVRMAMSFAIQQQIQNNLTGIGGLVLLVGGGVAVANGAMSLGDLLAFYLAAGSLNGSVSRLTSVIPDLIAGDESLRKLMDLRDEVAEPTYRGTRTLAFKGEIALADVQFAYDGKPVLEGVSLRLAPGSKTALVGPNGAGKSTIVNLILGFYKPTAGALAADGVAYGELDLKVLRRQIGVVMQKPTFFTGTIAENLAYGWPDAAREEILAAAQIACADAFVSKLPLAYDTPIGEGGLLLSGGEAQRLAIARALIGRPRLLILDEPTNHLDAQAIRQIMGRISQDAHDTAVLTISHDMAVVGFADTVLRLEDGRLTPVAREAAPVS